MKNYKTAPWWRQHSMFLLMQFTCSDFLQVSYCVIALHPDLTFSPYSYWQPVTASMTIRIVMILSDGDRTTAVHSPWPTATGSEFSQIIVVETIIVSPFCQEEATNGMTFIVTKSVASFAKSHSELNRQQHRLHLSTSCDCDRTLNNTVLLF